MTNSKEALEFFLFTKLKNMLKSQRDLKEKHPHLEFSPMSYKDENLIYMISKSLQKNKNK